MCVGTRYDAALARRAPIVQRTQSKASANSDRVPAQVPQPVRISSMAALLPERSAGARWAGAARWRTLRVGLAARTVRRRTGRSASRAASSATDASGRAPDGTAGDRPRHGVLGLREQQVGAVLDRYRAVGGHRHRPGEPCRCVVVTRLHGVRERIACRDVGPQIGVVLLDVG